MKNNYTYREYNEMKANSIYKEMARRQFWAGIAMAVGVILIVLFG